MRGIVVEMLMRSLRRALAAFAVFTLSAMPAFAQGAPDPYGLAFGTATGLATGDIREIAGRIINAFLGLLGLLAVCLVLYAGFLWMTARGDEAQVTKAKLLLRNAVIGLVIILMSYAIVTFVIRAITGDESGTYQGCPPGQVCGSGGGGLGDNGGPGGFHVTSIVPAGAGRSNGGSPKSSRITIFFNAAIKSETATPATVLLRRCNPRVGITGSVNMFDYAACGDAVAVTLTVDGSMLHIKPAATPGEFPFEFEADYWYSVRVQGGAVRDASGRTLLCPLQTIDISSSGAGVDYCERAMAFNAIRDVEPPTVVVNAPASPGPYCASEEKRVAELFARGQDDFLVAAIEFVLDGGAANLVDAEKNPLSVSPNASQDNPFDSTGLFADLERLAPGRHTISAVARDSTGLASPSVSREFSTVPSSCCNAIIDEGETELNCGGTSQCGSCTGGSCTTGADCASGFCNAQGTCEERPFIQGISPLSGGPGSMVTISGTSFGGAAGSIAFLGADTDGNGEVEGDADDVIAAACDPQAWKATQVVVAVPTGAVSGPLKLITAAGPSDRSDDTSGPVIGSFTVTTEVLPGVCYLSPSTGAPGEKFSINGSGFGESSAGTASFGKYGLTVVSCAAGAQECGWTGSTIWAVVPPIKENVYQVKVATGGKTSNSASFVLRTSSTTSVPRITAVIPENGPPGSYVTVLGTGFRNSRGLVHFLFGKDVALAGEPVCDDNWHDTYIIVKVPDRYADGTPINISGAGVAHKIKVTTAPPSLPSEEAVSFGVIDGPARPGICSITPDNGVPGKTVAIVQGEGFGAGPTADLSRYSVEFFKSQAKRCLNDQSKPCTNVGQVCSDPSDGICAYTSIAATGYSSWSGVQIAAVVAGETSNKETWPASGPVFVVSDNLLSANAVPFTVQDCNENGGRCAEGQICCASGSCQASCGPLPRDSAYGWRFSTDVLPTLPIVIERAQCDLTSTPTSLQSPSPFKNSTDACINAQNYFAFSRRLDAASFTPSTVKMEECGSGQSPACTGAVPLAPFGPTSFADCDSLNADSCASVMFNPANTYNGGNNFKKNTWYRVTLVSDVASGIGIREVDQGRYLDGDNDKRQGGNYVLMFRVRDSDLPCQVEGAAVIAPKAVIEQDREKVNFAAGLIGGNCNKLLCDGKMAVTLGWTAEAAYLNKLGVLNDGCTQPVRAVSETLPGATTPLGLEVEPKVSGPSLRANADITVAFADPRVVSVTPAAACEAACINAAIGATFNIPMDAQTISASTVEIRRCRNGSCNPPYAPDLNGLTASVTAPVNGMSPSGSVHKSARITLSGNLQPNTWYIVSIGGGESGVKSASGVPLSGLNDGTRYSWKFKTKDDTTACLSARTAVMPERAVLKYEGARADLVATPFGSPDACSEEGQELNARAYDWRWSIVAPNAVIQGFIDGFAPFSPDSVLADPGTLVDRALAPRLGCTDRCVPTGSQNKVPQCGNGSVDAKFEECDDGNQSGADGCTAQCLFAGSRAPACGDGTIDAAAGESCDMIEGVFPPGCKAPGVVVSGFADDIGCIFTGSQTAPSSRCGDGIIGDGEACDDGNGANGDGCSAECLHEGTLRSCLDVTAGGACVNFCGNGRVEPGEQTACEPNPSAAGCNTSTCIRLGSNPELCGNGTIDNGEDPACETDPYRDEICNERCLRKGSSSLYAEPSFCGDGIVGAGEYPVCEAGLVPDTKIDHTQTVAVAQQNGQTDDTSTVLASVEGVPESAVGSAELTLEQFCGTLPEGEQDAYCASIAPPGVQLGCSANGTCVRLPSVVQFQPTSYAACRNAEVRVVFSHLMDENSVRLNMQVGVDKGTAACADGTTEVGPISRARGGFFARIWTGIVSFFRDHILRPAFGAPPSAPTDSEQKNRYCSVEGEIRFVDDGPSEARYTVAYFTPRRAFPAQRYVRVHVASGARTVSGVNFPEQGFTQYFATGQEVCQIEKVSVTPAFVMLPNSSASQAVTAHAVSANGQAIVPTDDYRWRWEWTSTATTSPIVIVPRSGTAASCSLSAACADPAGCECRSELAVCTVAQNATVCASNTETLSAVADISARNAGVEGRAADGPVPVEAVAVIGQNANRFAVSSIATTDSGYALMLCADPWPQYQRCVNGKVTPPWDSANPRDCTGDTWLPFTDPATSTQLYYCRAVQTSGDESSLPCLKEAPARVTQIGSGILQEYLFTFDASPSNCPGGPATTDASGKPAQWLDDAVGIRVSQNPQHVSVREWYRQRGFNGNPAPAIVDGYEALQEGRTTYVNAATKTEDQRLFTNVNTFSYNDGAAPETVAVFGQMLRNINFNSTADMADFGLCRSNTFRSTALLRCNTDEDCRVNAAGTPVPGRLYTCDTARSVCMDGTTDVPGVGRGVACESDLECRVDAAGQPITGRVTGFCDLPKTKLIRDVRRWGDLQSIRSSAISRITNSGKGPTLDAGSFLRGRSVSAWPSWAGTFSSELGASAPTDPLNRHGVCAGAGIDPITCWNAGAGAYVLPPFSNVYGFETLGPTDFRLAAVLEYGQNESGTRPRWSGETCIEKTVASNCNALPDCAFVDGLCEYKVGKIALTSPSNPFTSPAMTDASYGPGRCGDGVRNALEQCEPGETKVDPCQSTVGGIEYTGAVSVSCTQSCTWQAPGECKVGRCGDGVVQSPESCDDGENNGKYGYCSASCASRGFYCGDYAVQPGEVCDCGPRNGQYYFEGIVAKKAGDTVLKFDEASGATTFADSTGKGVSASCSGADCPVAGVSGRQGKALDFQGADYISVNQNLANLIGGTASVSYWIKTSQENTKSDNPWASPGITGVEDVGGSDDVFWGYIDKSGRIGIQAGGVAGAKSDSAINDDAWHHVVLTRNASTGTVKVFVDGALHDSGVSETGTKTTPFYDIGRIADTNDTPIYFDGLLDEFAIYSGVELNIEEVRHLYGLGSIAGVCGGTGQNVPSCSWDCSGAGPRCGDGIKNNTEECDGGFEEYKGHCSDADETGCNTDAECPSGSTCGNFCDSVEQKLRRTCATNYPSIADENACTWNEWTCTAPGECGNGVKESGEACDDGNDDESDACTNACTVASCGDGKIQPGLGETCDLGAKNGQSCTPGYGGTCTYCSIQCRTASVTGAFCGDGVIQGLESSPKGPEHCDAGQTGTGTRGLSGYICVSSLEVDQSRGKMVPGPTCSSSSCLRLCPPNGDLCHNVSGSDTDKDGLYDVCDPDDDNDRVPDTHDCAPTNANIHPAYSKPGVSVSAATESCDNNDDDDCDGKTNEIVDISGTLVDVRTDEGIDDMDVEVVCGTTVLASGQTDNGDFRLRNNDAKVDACGSTVTVRVKNVAAYCPQGSFRETSFKRDTCVNNDEYDIPDADTEAKEDPSVLVKDFKPMDLGIAIKPKANQYVATITWDTSKVSDFDYHVFTSNDLHLFYNASSNCSDGELEAIRRANGKDSDDSTYPRACINDKEYIYTLDVDATGGSRNRETVTINQRPGVVYSNRVWKYSTTDETYSTAGLRMQAWAVSPLTGQCTYYSAVPPHDGDDSNKGLCGFKLQQARYRERTDTKDGVHYIDWPFFKCSPNISLERPYMYTSDETSFSNPPGCDVEDNNPEKCPTLKP